MANENIGAVNDAENILRQRHSLTNGNIRPNDRENVHTTSTGPSTVMKQINLQKIKDKAHKLRTEFIELVDTHLQDVLEEFIEDVEKFEIGPQTNGLTSYPKVEKADLPDKVFLNRKSILTELFEINHIQTIYHIFVAILILFSFNTIVYDIIDKQKVDLDFALIQFAFGKLPSVMAIWVIMKLSTALIVFPLFHYWAHNRNPSVAYVDYVWLLIYIAYQCAFFGLPVKIIVFQNLPVASSLIISMEQVRMSMKVHAFVRENIPRALAYKPHSVDTSSDGDLTPCPDFSKYLYFLFAPTLVYRDSYPRTQKIRWNYVVTNFAQVVGCLFYTYFIFMRFCVPVFQNFNQEHVTPKALILSVFGCMLPATLVLLVGFFAILHSWFNAFAEMLRFGDRMFYRDWWNSTSFSNYYRTWNVVVHDWLYCYVYKDFDRLLGPKSRPGSMWMVFLLSAIVHEYVLTISFRFFYPVLFFMFAGAGVGFIFLTNKRVSRSWNVFMWVILFMGNGMLMCLYSMEWYARANCPSMRDSFLDYLIPRSWFCTVSGSNR